MSMVHPWEKSYPAGVSWRHPIGTGLVTDLIDEAADKAGDRPFVHFREWQCTYAELKNRADAFAAALLRDGLAPATSIAVYLPNTPYHTIAFFGILRAGARVVHLSPLDAPRELAHKLRDSGATTIVTTNVGDLLGTALGLLDYGTVSQVIVGDDAEFGGDDDARAEIPDRAGVSLLIEMTADASHPAVWPALEPNDIALLQFTGGTTGLPKGAIISHANLMAANSAYDGWYGGIYGRDKRERVLCVLPLSHSFGLSTVFLYCVRRQGELFLQMRFDAGSVLETIEREGIEAFSGVPTMWIALANHPDFTTRDLSSLERVAAGGAPLPPEVSRRIDEYVGPRLTNGWGMTETSPPGTFSLASGDPRPGSIGIPLPGIEIQIVAADDASRVLDANEIGELRVRGKNVTSGYWNRPEETKAAFVDGYFLTGDLGYMDDDGFFYLVDRKKDMIISSGFNVYPQSVEQAIYEHPAVSECVVVGVPDDYRGESAKAFVTLRPHAKPFSLEDLQDFLTGRLGRHELPRALEFRDALPKTSVGKLSRKTLQDEEKAKLTGRQDA